MSMDRILGQHVELHIYSLALKRNVLIGEIDSVSGNDKTKVLESQPLFQTTPHPQVVPGGWDLQCKGGKVNGCLQSLIWDRDFNILQGKASPRYTLIVTTHFYDGSKETYAYCDGVLSGFKFDATKSDQEVTEDFTFTASYRVPRMPGVAGLPTNPGGVNHDYGKMNSHWFLG